MPHKGSLLHRRLIQFAVDIANLCSSLDKGVFEINLANQMIRSSTSAALNHSEAIGASSLKDFINKLRIVLKELRETHTGLDLLIIKREDDMQSPIGILYKEADELCAIVFSSIKTAESKL